jgi:hypothetical protein
MTYGPQVPECDLQHAAKYRGPGESFEEACNRQAVVLAPGEHYKPYREILLEQRFLAGGRIQLAIGSTRNITPYNCLEAGTRFITREHGVIDLSTAYEYGEVTLLDGNGEWQRAKINEFGIRDLREVRLTSGRISQTVWATPDHRWILADGSECVTGNLRRGLSIAYLHAPGLKTEQDRGECPINYLDGLAHGIIYGDGSFRRAGRFQIPSSTFSDPPKLLWW